MEQAFEPDKGKVNGRSGYDAEVTSAAIPYDSECEVIIL